MNPHPALFLFSLLYGLVIWLRNLFFDIGIFKSVDVGVPIISIGNITTGGTGKTPVVKNVAHIFLDAKKKTAIISRGYRRNTKGTVVVCDGNVILSDANASGDEPLLLAQQLKSAIVIVDEDRVRGAAKAIKEFGAEIIILDDGFQHRSIKRTKDIVLIDSQRSPFEEMLLPSGYRREFKSSFLRADAVIVTKVQDEKNAKEILTDDFLQTVQHKFSSSFQPSGVKHLFGGVQQSTDILKGHTAIAVCGIADPKSFERTLATCGVVVKKFIEFPDHHSFTKQDVDRIIRSFNEQKTDFILTTEKDAVRLKQFELELKNLPFSAIAMDVVIHQHDEWKKFLLSVFDK